MNQHLQALNRAGLHVSLVGGRLHVSPKERITEQARQIIRYGRESIIESLSNPIDAEIEAARLTVTRAAIRANLKPAEVWGWLSSDDLEWIGQGGDEALEALRAYCEYWKQYGSQTTGNHEIPYHRGLE